MTRILGLSPQEKPLTGHSRLATRSFHDMNPAVLAVEIASFSLWPTRSKYS
jgi:hypothetical protein